MYFGKYTYQHDWKISHLAMNNSSSKFVEGIDDRDLLGSAIEFPIVFYPILLLNRPVISGLIDNANIGVDEHKIRSLLVRSGWRM